ncbi:hypothetical protein LshimejAT787_0601140 [Lyophyllum shimeji]|uniref:Uncharacterized protein n=1 Tax=Lyophyllum shimeji TaxID=47721 RepID=A0A9P3UN44_LYOSH|nr:hypothetical protein LshimejAT787_0601140 [Lyophyllum shimeji]
MSTIRTSAALDVEQGVFEQKSAEDVLASLHELQAELHAFLTTHTSRLVSLRNTLAGSDPRGIQRPISNLTNRDSGFATSISSASVSKTSPNDAPGLPTEELDAHVWQLDKFLRSEIHIFAKLRDRLPLAPGKESSSNATKDAKHKEDAAFEALVSQFNMLVVISTFTASLIVSFLSLVKSIVVDNHPVAFDIGMLLSFLAMSLHFGNIIVAGRGSALTSQRAADRDGRHDLAYFRHYLALCEQLQFLATVVFLVSIVQLTFFIFHDIIFPFVLLGCAVFGGLVVFWSAYWQVSMTYRNLHFVFSKVRGFAVTSTSYLRGRYS